MKLALVYILIPTNILKTRLKHSKNFYNAFNSDTTLFTQTHQRSHQKQPQKGGKSVRLHLKIHHPNRILNNLMRYVKIQNHETRLPNSSECILQVDCTQSDAWQYLQKKQEKVQSVTSL